MSLISLVIVLIIVGVLLWLVNTQLSAFIDAKILKIINVVVIVAVILWLLSVLFGFNLHDLGDIRIGR